MNSSRQLSPLVVLFDKIERISADSNGDYVSFDFSMRHGKLDRLNFYTPKLRHHTETSVDAMASYLDSVIEKGQGSLRLKTLKEALKKAESEFQHLRDAIGDIKSELDDEMKGGAA